MLVEFYKVLYMTLEVNTHQTFAYNGVDFRDFAS